MCVSSGKCTTTRREPIRRDAVDQRRQFIIVMDVAVEIVLLLHHDLGTAGGKPDQVEAKAGIEGIGERIQPFAEQAIDDGWARHRLAGVDEERAHRAVGAEEARFQPARALALLLHRSDQCHGKPRQRRRYHAVGRDWLGKTLLDDVIRQRLARTDRAIALPQRLREERGEGGTEPRGDLTARTRGDIADGLQSGAAQAIDDCLMRTERPNRQRADGFGFLAIGNDAAMDMPRQGARADRGRGYACADRKALHGQGIAEQFQQRVFAAEQMGAAGDVEKQTMRRIERNQRRETVAPVGDSVECPGVRRFIGVVDLQMRTDGAGIGERHADREVLTRGGIVERIELQRVVLLDDDDAGSIVINSRAAETELPLDAVDGQARQPQTENPPSR